MSVERSRDSDEVTVMIPKDDAELARLRRAFRGWRVRRTYRGTTPVGWVATNRDPTSDRAPTLHADSAAELERQLLDPPERWAKSFVGRAVNVDIAMRATSGRTSWPELG